MHFAVFLFVTFCTDGTNNNKNKKFVYRVDNAILFTKVESLLYYKTLNRTNHCITNVRKTPPQNL
jgi:hypothetical protein